MIKITEQQLREIMENAVNKFIPNTIQVADLDIDFSGLVDEVILQAGYVQNCSTEAMKENNVNW